MQITSSRKPGNRRSVDNPGSGPVPATSQPAVSQLLDKAPTISNQPFNNPGRPVINEMPSIKNVIEPQQSIKTVPQTNTSEEPVSVEPQPADATAPPVDESPAEEPVETNADFEKCWLQMVENMFHTTPSTYFILKRNIPKYENDVITIEVQSPLIGEDLEKRKREILEYWRSHFKLNVDDFEIIVNSDMKVNTAVLTADDQFKKMKEQNPQLLEFLKALDFKMSN